MRLLALSLAGFTAVLIPPAAEACAPPRLVDVAMIADGATLLDDGGVVIETRNGSGGGDELERGLTLMTDGKPLTATVHYLAPGLSVIRPPRGEGRTITAVDGDNKVQLTLTQARAKAPHAAPKAAQMRSSLARAPRTKQPPQRRMGVEASSAELTLTEAPPSDVIAIVAYSITKNGPRGIAWWRPAANQLVYEYSTGGKGCVPGPVPIRQGERVAIGFVDSHGRTSPLSKPLAIGALKIQR